MPIGGLVPIEGLDELPGLVFVTVPGLLLLVPGRKLRSTTVRLVPPDEGRVVTTPLATGRVQKEG